MRLYLARKLHAPAHAGVVHQTGQGKAILRGVVVAAGAPQLDAAACFPDLILKAVDVHRAADDLRLFALHFQRHGLGVLEIRQENTAPVQTGRDVVLVTPTYAWRIPRVVSEWLCKTALTGAERVWFVMDCGSEIGNAAVYNRQLAAQKQLQYMGTAQIIMPENYIAMFNAPRKEQAKSIVEQAEPALQKVLTQLKAGQEFPPPRENLYDRLMSGPVNPVFYRFFVKADAFRATDACIGCGKCVELCPLNNIRLKNSKPVWGKNCTHCMACICYCPKEAIEYGKKSREKPRYHFEALERKQQDV